MFSIGALIERFGTFVLFVILECICLFFIVSFNQRQRDIFVHSTNLLSKSVFTHKKEWREYLSLRKENDRLKSENAKLLKEIILHQQPGISDSHILSSQDTLGYVLLSTEILNQSINGNRNYFTLKLTDTIPPRTDMGLMTDQGAAGLINRVEEPFCTGLSLMHIDMRLSATIKGRDYFGTVTWPGQQVNKLRLEGIPKHAQFDSGDTVVTNGYSDYFPKNIPIGTVDKYEFDKTGEFYRIELTSIVDFSSISDIYLITASQTEKRKELEEMLIR